MLVWGSSQHSHRRCRNVRANRARQKEMAPMTSSLAPSIVTHRDPKGLKFVSIVEAAYNGARLSEEEAQRINDASGLGDLIGTFIANNRSNDRFVNEEVRSSYTSPGEFKGPKPILEQIQSLASILGLDPTAALQHAHILPMLDTFVPAEALPYVGWYAVPRDVALADILGKLAASRRFYNWRESQMDNFRTHERTARFMAEIAKTQGNSDIYVIAAQLGMRHRGCSVRRARKRFAGNEFGLTPAQGGAVTLTHPERFVRWEQLHMDLPGGEFDDPDSGVRFGRAPILGFSGGGVEFGTGPVDGAGDQYGSASAFLP